MGRVSSGLAPVLNILLPDNSRVTGESSITQRQA